MKKLTLPILALFIPALAVQAGDEELTLFSQLDTDKNGLVSKQEAGQLKKLVVMFEKLDVDSDGQLSLSEFEVLAKE